MLRPGVNRGFAAGLNMALLPGASEASVIAPSQGG
jgi:hypothetical protein